MARQIGPFDKRFKRKRCMHCAKTHSKCDGQLPCKQCLLTGRVCSSVVGTTRKIELQVITTQYGQQTLGSPSPPCAIDPTWAERCVPYFFTSFLQRHNFTGQVHDDHPEMQKLLHTSSCFRKAVLALSTLELASHKLYPEEVQPNSALTYYHDAVSSLRLEIGGDPSREGPADHLLWTTLLLGIFELMNDASGKGFLFHFVKGTSVLLQSRPPSYYAQTGKLDFLRFARMFETMRATMYWTDSFMQDTQWQSVLEQTTRSADGQKIDGLCAFETVNRLIGRAVKLNNRTDPIVRNIAPFNIDDEYVQILTSAAHEGLSIRRDLDSWHSSTSLPRLSDDIVIDPQLILAHLYYHAISMNLNSIFWPHEHFRYLALETPTLSDAEVQSHVGSLFLLIPYALKYTSLAGSLLIWPIRGAGSRSISVEQVQRVEELLDEVERRGFAITRPNRDYLHMRWEIKGLI